jgi:hypothetical protein
MALQNVNVILPEDIYRRFEDMAAVTHRSLEDVLVETLQGNLPPVVRDVGPEQRDLVAGLQQLDDEALWAIAKENIPAPQWRRHRHLLRKVALGTLTPSDQAELDDLHTATDRFAIRRSYALALLKWRGYTIPAVP